MRVLGPIRAVTQEKEMLVSAYTKTHTHTHTRTHTHIVLNMKFIRLNK